MIWLVRCLDRAGASARREAARPAHSARLRALPTRPLLYGPLVADDGTTPIGSLLIVQADTREEVERLVAEDPFQTERVWGEVTIHAMSVSASSPAQLPTPSPEGSRR